MTDAKRLTRAERHLIRAEYLLDSTLSHVRQKGCADVRPRAMGRIQEATNKLRGALALVRLEQGARHPTLFAGTADPKSPANDPTKGRPGARGQKQKTWGTSRPHRWAKDCDDDHKIHKMLLTTTGPIRGDRLPPDLEVGVEASCWHCDGIFRKLKYCSDCGFFRCPHCGKCACQLDAGIRRILEKTVRALRAAEVAR